MTAGYISLFSRNANYRNLFCAHLVSFIGDWFGVIAVFTLLAEIKPSGGNSASALALAVVLLIKQIPIFLFAPLAGPIADRFNRRNILFLMDIVRVGLTCGLLFIPKSLSADAQVLVVYGVVFLQSIASAFFEPARAALTTELVDPKDLTTTSALGSMVWSVSLIIGSALGGIVTEKFGWNIAIIIDSFSFLLSAFFITNILYCPISNHHHVEEKRGLKELWIYFQGSPAVLRMALAKFSCGFGGAAYLILAVLGQRVFTVGERGVLGISLLYAARASGAFLGPFIGRYFASNDQDKMRYTVLVGLFMFATAYILLGVAWSWPTALICVGLAHFGGSLMWGFSTVLIQLNVPNEFRGRVFGFELGMATVSNSISLLVYGYLMDQWPISPQNASLLMGTILLSAALWWRVEMRRWWGQ